MMLYNPDLQHIYLGKSPLIDFNRISTLPGEMPLKNYLMVEG